MTAPRTNIHCPLSKFPLSKPIHRTIAEKYNALEKEYMGFRKQTSLEFESFRNLYNTEISNLTARIKEHNKSQPKGVLLKHQGIEAQSEQSSISSLSRILIESFNVQRVSEMASKSKSRPRIPHPNVQYSTNNCQSKLGSFGLSQDQNKIRQFLPEPREEKSHRVLSNMRREVKWAGHATKRIL